VPPARRHPHRVGLVQQELANVSASPSVLGRAKIRGWVVTRTTALKTGSATPKTGSSAIAASSQPRNSSCRSTSRRKA
jgi:hypothetical protein